MRLAALLAVVVSPWPALAQEAGGPLPAFAEAARPIVEALAAHGIAADLPVVRVRRIEIRTEYDDPPRTSAETVSFEPQVFGVVTTSRHVSASPVTGRDWVSNRRSYCAVAEIVCLAVAMSDNMVDPSGRWRSTQSWVTSVDALDGRLFPLVVGNRLHVRFTWTSGTDEVVTESFLDVVEERDGSSVHPRLGGPVYSVRESSTVTGPTGLLDAGKRTWLFSEQLGIPVLLQGDGFRSTVVDFSIEGGE